MVRHVLSLAACAAISSIFMQPAHASSYASGVSESGGLVTFRLNAPASQVIVIRDGVEQDLGALPAGTASFTRDGAANYKIKVRSQSGPGWMTPAPSDTGTFASGGVLQLNDEANKSYWFNSPRGVVVDNNLSSPSFGRIVVANSAAGTVGTTPNTRAVGDGFYALNSDGTDALGQGDTALTGGLSWTSSSNSPWRMTFGPDNKMYVSDWSDATGGITRLDNDLTNGVELLAGRGDISNVNVHGSIASRVLVEGTGDDMKIYALDEDMTGSPLQSKNPTPTTFQSLLRWDVGTLTAYNSPPTKVFDFPDAVTNVVSGVIVDVARASDGKYFLSQRRSAGTEPGLIVTDASGAILWDSLTATRAVLGDASAPDMFREVWSMQLSPDGTFVTMPTITSDVLVVPIDPGTGLPDMTQAKLIEAGTVNQGRAIEADRAGNIYLSTSGNARLRVMGPGGVNETLYDSSGTFSRSTSSYAGTWSGTGGGTFTSAANWQDGFVPTGAAWAGFFNSNITSASTIDLGGGSFITGSIWIDTPATLTFGGTGTMQFTAAVSRQNTGFVVKQGHHAVTAPLVITSNFAANVAANSSLTLTDASVTAAQSMFLNTGANASLSIGNVVSSGVNSGFFATLGQNSTITVGGTPQVSTVNVNAGTNSVFSMTNVTYGTTRFTVTKTGAGTLLIPRLNASTLTVSAGTAKLTQNGAASVCNVFNIPVPDGVSAGTLDMGTQKLVIDYPVAPAVSPLPFVLTNLQNGFANGTWDGPGLTSSAARDSQSQTNKGALAYFEASQTGTTSFGGITVDASAICIMYTSQGDATLDGKTDTMDFNILAHNFGGSGKTSIEGEFTYDDSGTVDSTDFNVFLGGYGSVIPLSAPNLGAVVPEPASIGVALLVPLMALRRHRRA